VLVSLRLAGRAVLPIYRQQQQSNKSSGNSIFLVILSRSTSIGCLLVVLIDGNHLVTAGRITMSKRAIGEFS
jgi:hypothetical protein